MIFLYLKTRHYKYYTLNTMYIKLHKLSWIRNLTKSTKIDPHQINNHIILYKPLQHYRKPGTFNHEKLPMVKYSRMQRKVPSRLVCGSYGTYLDCMLLRVQVTTGLGFFSVFRSFNLVKIVTPCSKSFSFLAGPWWDSKIENTIKHKHTL